VDRLELPEDVTAFYQVSQYVHDAGFVARVEREVWVFPVAIDAETGKATAVVNEECKTFFDYSAKLYLQYLDATNELVWMSERSGWNHLYLIDAKDGTVKNAITKGEWAVRGIEQRVDAEKREVLIRAVGVKPAGLGARDTLRLEAGMNLYGQDMDETVTPWEAGLAWTVSLDEGRDFIGRKALEKQKADGVKRVLVGLIMDDKGVLRHGQRVATPAGDGEILSGGFSPTIGKSIAFARVPAGAGDVLEADIRGRLVPVRVVKYPFVRDGQPTATV
jgi:hypothetical protein